MSTGNRNTDPDARRRGVLKRILAGGGAVVTAAAAKDQWTRPVVESVVLPAHAQTSVPGTTPSQTTAAPTTSLSPTTTPAP